MTYEDYEASRLLREAHARLSEANGFLGRKWKARTTDLMSKIASLVNDVRWESDGEGP